MFLLRNVQTGWWPRPFSYLLGTGGLSRGLKWSRHEASRSPPSVVPRLRMLLLTYHVRLHGLGKENFTLLRIVVKCTRKISYIGFVVDAASK